MAVRSVLHINGHDAWRKLLKLGTPLPNTVIDLARCGDGDPFSRAHIVPFPHAHTLFVRRCDKNFVYYWVNQGIFPQARQIFLASHPCDPLVLRGFSEKKATIYLEEHFADYKRRWAPDSTRVQVITRDALAKAFLKAIDYPEYMEKELGLE